MLNMISKKFRFLGKQQTANSKSNYLKEKTARILLQPEFFTLQYLSCEIVNQQYLLKQI